MNQKKNPIVYLRGILFSVSFFILPRALTAATWMVPVAPQGPFDRVYYPQNAPVGSDINVGPLEWTQMNLGADHNADVPLSGQTPLWSKNGVSWRFAEARAWPLENKDPFGAHIYGQVEAGAVQTQFYGNALGVSVVDGILYAESDDMFAYALNMKTGQLIWRTSPVGNHLMGNPIVKGRFVYLSAGGVGFNFANVVKYAKNPYKAVRGMDFSYNGIYALDRLTGRLIWRHSSVGEAMPTPAVHGDVLYFATGSGSVHAINRHTGQTIWTTRLTGSDNMSSPAYYQGKLYLALAIKPRLYCLDAKTGKILWKNTLPGAANTGMGDVSPAVSNGVVIMDAVTSPKTVRGKTTLNPVIRAFDSNSGAPLWTASMGRGPKPPAFKGGVPMIYGGVVYVGSPVNGAYQARDLKTGKLLWKWNKIASARSAPTMDNNVLYIAGAESVYALNPRTGKEMGRVKIGGRMGIVSPTIVGGTIYLSNTWDWIVALPKQDVLSSNQEKQKQTQPAQQKNN